MRSTGFVLVLSLVGCDSSLNEKQHDARRAEADTEERIDTAVKKTQQEIDAARIQASEKIANARQDAAERADDALTEGREEVREAQASGRKTVQEANDAIRESGRNSRLSIEKDLDEIDRRVKAARENMRDETNDSIASTSRSLTNVSESSAKIREEVKVFESKTVQSIQAFQSDLNQKIGELLASLEKVEKT